MKLTKLKDITPIFSYAQIGSRCMSGAVTVRSVSSSTCHFICSVVHLLSFHQRTKHCEQCRSYLEILKRRSLGYYGLPTFQSFLNKIKSIYRSFIGLKL